MIRKEWTSPCGRIRLFRGDCLAKLPLLTDVVDFVLTDPPYGVTDCHWDQAPPLPQLAARLIEVTKPAANWCVFATQPFATDLITAWRKHFRYELIWQKNRPVGFLNANRQPMRKHELILLFGRAKGAAVYHPQFTTGKPYKSTGKRSSNVYSGFGDIGPSENKGTRHPTSIVDLDESSRGRLGQREHGRRMPQYWPPFRRLRAGSEDLRNRGRAAEPKGERIGQGRGGGLD